MANIILPPKWAIPARETTPEAVFLDRRAFMKKAGLTAALAVGGGIASCGGSKNPNLRAEAPPDSQARKTGPVPQPAEGLYPPSRNKRYVIDRPLTKSKVAGSHNNFYEFTHAQSHGPSFQNMVREVAKDYRFRPWEVEIGGLCEAPRTMSIDEIEKLAPLEERLYRFRCVETWAMAVPWVGYPLSRLIQAVKPKPEATHVRFYSWLDMDLPGVKIGAHYPWPYFEGLRMDEAMNELMLLCTGIYGKPLPNQHGAPVRIIAPWKYGYKSPKSIARIELTAEEPPTFWNKLAPKEYSFLSNVNPYVPHPRWSQAQEWMIPDRSERHDTQIFNGYGEFVADLYPDEPRKRAA